MDKNEEDIPKGCALKIGWHLRQVGPHGVKSGGHSERVILRDDDTANLKVWIL